MGSKKVNGNQNYTIFSQIRKIHPFMYCINRRVVKSCQELGKRGGGGEGDIKQNIHPCIYERVV